MNSAPAQLNLIAAWVGILLGFISGMGLGLFFHREDWLGGYGSRPRRMYRLGHISFFGLGAVNLFFWLTLKNFRIHGAGLEWAAGLFVLGALTMPLCCGLMAHWPKLRLSFAVPVVSLIVAAGLTVAAVVDSAARPAATPQLSIQNAP